MNKIMWQLALILAMAGGVVMLIAVVRTSLYAAL